MRDIFVIGIVLGLLPVALVRPYIGLLLFTWVSVMNPHKLAWGFAVDFPVAQLAALATLVGIVFSNKDRRYFPVTPVTVILITFVIWMCITSLFALYPALIGAQFEKVMKIQLMIMIALLLVHTKEQIIGLLTVIALSLAFYGVKGGLFTIRGGGSERVWGPPGGFIEGNNELALAVIMTVPLLYFLRLQSKNKWIRFALLASMLLCAVSALGSHSRGALLAIAAMTFMLWTKSKYKVLTIVPIVIIAAALLAFMPEKWSSRMETISTHQDRSAQSRINAWWMAYNLASDRFLGGGFEVAVPELFARYSPAPELLQGAHSIYFQVLGEHGFVGLGIFLLLWLLVWSSASWTARHARRIPDMLWAEQLSNMIKVSLIAYFVGGAFLGLAYFDVPYFMLVLVIATRILVQARVTEVSRRVSPGRTSHAVG